VMRVDLEQKLPVGSSSRDEGGPSGNKKIPVGSLSSDEGGP
jgi:hypothetical protein